MKKIIASLFAVLALSAAMQAQQIGSNRFGVDVGFTSSSANVSDFKVSNVSGFHAGVYYQIPLVSGLSLQPGIQYQMKGANLGTAGDANVKWLDTVMHYIEVPVQIQYGIDLMYLRPYAFAEPFIGMAVGTNSSTAANQEQTDPDTDRHDQQRRIDNFTNLSGKNRKIRLCNRDKHTHQETRTGQKDHLL